MSKIHLSRGLLLASTVMALYGAPAFAQMMAPPSDTYAPPNDNMPAEQQGMVRSYAQAPDAPPPPLPHMLGTIPRSELNGDASAVSPMAPSSTQAIAAPAQMAPDSYTAMQQMQNGEIRYVTGGIGDEERDGLKVMEKDYDLHVMSAAKNGSFVGDTQIKITSAKGTDLLTTVAGPIFFADLPDGKYVLEASVNGEVRRQAFTAKHGKVVAIHLSW